MAALIFNIIFTFISLLSNLISFTLFNLIAFVLVSIIQSFKASGEAVQVILEQLGGVVKWVFDRIWELALDSVWNLVTYVLELVWERAWDSAGLSGSAVAGLVESTKEGINGMMESDPEILNGFWEMVGSVGGGFWSNCADAAKHVFENA